MKLPPRRSIVRGVVALAGLGLLAAAGVASGIVSVKASSGHWPVTEWLLHFAMRRSVATHSIGIEPPPDLDDERLVLLGAGYYESGCRFCHGLPGGPRPRVAAAMTPYPPDLAERAPIYDDAGLFYVVRHGIKFTGMPAFPVLDREDEIWAVVAFVRRFPELDAAGYRRLVFGPGAGEAAPAAPVGDPVPAARASEARPPEVVVETCARCHGADGLGRGVGAFPRLAGQRPEYLCDALAAYASGRRPSGVMETIAHALDAEAVGAAVRWYAALPGLGGGAPAAPPAAPREGLGARIAHGGVPERRLPACAECHGPKEGPVHPAYPELAGQYAEYLELQLRLFSKGRRGGGRFAGLMEVVAAHDLEPDEVRAVARYFAGLPAAPPGAPPGDCDAPDRLTSPGPSDAPASISPLPAVRAGRGRPPQAAG